MSTTHLMASSHHRSSTCCTHNTATGLHTGSACRIVARPCSMAGRWAFWHAGHAPARRMHTLSGCAPCVRLHLLCSCNRSKCRYGARALGHPLNPSNKAATSPAQTLATVAAWYLGSPPCNAVHRRQQEALAAPLAPPPPPAHRRADELRQPRACAGAAYRGRPWVPAALPEKPAWHTGGGLWGGWKEASRCC